MRLSLELKMQGPVKDSELFKWITEFLTPSPDPEDESEEIEVESLKIHTHYLTHEQLESLLLTSHINNRRVVVTNQWSTVLIVPLDGRS